jgi:hypothetical protein
LLGALGGYSEGKQRCWDRKRSGEGPVEVFLVVVVVVVVADQLIDKRLGRRLCVTTWDQLTRGVPVEGKLGGAGLLPRGV